MATSWRSFQSYIYAILMAVGAVLLLITFNDLLFHNQVLIDNGFSLIAAGNREYWIFALSLIMAFTFVYMFIKVTNDAKKFKTLINSSSKHTFVKNLRQLQKISKNLGPEYVIELERSMEKWKVK